MDAERPGRAFGIMAVCSFRLSLRVLPIGRSADVNPMISGFGSITRDHGGVRCVSLCFF